MEMIDANVSLPYGQTYHSQMLSMAATTALMIMAPQEAY
jgi:hypothetical protein